MSLSRAPRTLERPVESSFGTDSEPYVWDWISSTRGARLHSVIVLTDRTLFITRDLKEDAAAKLLLAASEGDLAITARSAPSKNRHAIPARELVEISWVPIRKKAILHTTSGRAITVEFPNSELTTEVCAQVARSIGSGPRKVTNLGPAKAKAKSLMPFILSLGVSAGAAFVEFTTRTSVEPPAPLLWGSCGMLVGSSAVLAIQGLRTKVEKISVAVSRPKRRQ